MKTLKQLLANKNRPLAVVAPGDSVFHALTVMSKNNVGALLVLDGEQLRPENHLAGKNIEGNASE